MPADGRSLPDEGQVFRGKTVARGVISHPLPQRNPSLVAIARREGFCLKGLFASKTVARMNAGFSLRTLCQVAMLIALAFVLERLIPVIDIGTSRISFAFIPMMCCGMFFGPLWGAAAFGIADILGWPIMGQFPIPLILVSRMTEGFIFGLILHRKNIKTWPHSVISALLTQVICGMGLTTLGLITSPASRFFGLPYLPLLVLRLPQFAIIFTLQIVVFPALLKLREALQKAGYVTRICNSKIPNIFREVRMNLFNDGWLFAKNSPENFTPVEIPHDWLISDTLNLYENSVGFYKKTFQFDSAFQDKHVFIRFDGVMMDSTLFANDSKVGEWKYGYTAFEFDITDYLIKDRDNTILLKVNYQSPCSRWYTGAGIYRDVFLLTKNAAHFISDGIYITPKKQIDGQWVVEVEAEVEAGGQVFEVRHHVIETGGMTIPDARLWDINDPHLYHLKSELLVGGSVSDTVISRFGIRETEFKPDEGFFLNGRRVKLNGVCQHHDLGALGAAFNRDAMQRQLNILRGMGVNAIRTAHNPPSVSFMELADEMGFLVMSEILDMWRLPKTEYDYARFFDEWIERDVASWVRRDRNCPSVILWSIGNEIYDTHADYEKGAATLRLLTALVKEHDPNGHSAVTFSSNFMAWENTQKCADLLKIIGYNYAEELYHDHHRTYPDWVIYGGETCSIVQSRGVYHFPLGKELLHDDDMQCSAFGNSRTSWGARSIEKCITDDRDAYFSPGQFLWSGFDYIGEPTPYHTKNSYFGQIDTAGFPKDSYYIFKSAWVDYKADPFVHIYPYWDFSPGQVIDVCICTNAPKAELFFNGSSIGVFEVEQKSDKKLKGEFRVPYEPGELTGLAYDDEGNEVARTVRRSFGDAVRFNARPETVGELVFYEITALDKDDNIVENANNRVNVCVDNGVLLGLDNGDSTDYDQYRSSSRRLFNGKLLAIAKPDYPTATMSINLEMDSTDVPVRKVELTSDGFRIFAKTYPEDATYDDLAWRLTDVSGIDSPLGVLDVADDGRSAVLVPNGDGDAFVRCGIKNGGEHISLYSQIQLTLSGYGRPLLNPYKFLAGGLYNLSNSELANANERGVATMRKGKSHVGFADIDFGAFGSDEITLSLFALDSEPFIFEIWTGGMPEHGGILLFEPLYDKGTIWNTYIDATYKLPRRLRGIETICFVFNQKVHIGGFVFRELDKAFEKLYAADNDFIYGDSYSVADRAIEGIGNNVTIGFNDMDFGDNGAEAIEINLRCRRKNSFQVVTTDADSVSFSNMLEAEPSVEYALSCFSLDNKIKGKNTVSLVFLPGCDIDIEWIRFK